MSPRPADAGNATNRQLHDVVVPQLFVLHEGLEVLRRAGTTHVPTRVIEGLADTAAQLLEDLRTISRGESIGRGGSLQIVGRRLRAAMGLVEHLCGPRVDIEVDGDAEISPGLEEDLTAVLWEATTNATRHGGAGRVEVRLHSEGEHLTMSVVDDGRWKETSPSGSSGLHSLRARAEQAGGQCTVSSGPSGTRLCWSVPLATADRGGARR